MYHIRFRFLVADFIDSQEKEIIFYFNDKEVTLKSTKGFVIGSDLDLSIHVYNFSSKECAEDFGENLKISLLKSSIDNRIGINIGNDRVESGISDYMRNILLNDGIDCINNIYGLLVYEGDRFIKFSSVSASSVYKISSDIFVDKLKNTKEMMFLCRIICGAHASFFLLDMQKSLVLLSFFWVSQL